MLSAFDKQLLNLLQVHLPIAKRPFALLAEKLDTDEQTVLNRLRHLREKGYIRRIGPFFDSEKLGYTGTLVAVQTEADQVEAVAEFINRFPGVTHNYEREGRYNLWFALLTPNKQCQEEILADIRRQPGVKELLSMPAVKKFKVSVQFTLD